MFGITDQTASVRAIELRRRARRVLGLEATLDDVIAYAIYLAQRPETDDMLAYLNGLALSVLRRAA